MLERGVAAHQPDDQPSDLVGSHLVRFGVSPTSRSSVSDDVCHSWVDFSSDIILDL